MFDFEVHHIKGKNNVVADALLRLSIIEEGLAKCKAKGNINDFINAQVFSNCIKDILDTD